MYKSHHITTRLAAAVGFLALLLVSSTATADPSIRAPWSCGEAYEVSQSHKTGSHTGKGKWSWDFAMPVGTPLLAPADGVVRKVRQDSTRHGCDRSYAYDANYVIITFEDDTEVLFLHLQAHSVPLEEGDRVSRGELIGRVGMSGYTCGPHLHMQVQQTCDSWWCSSMPAVFEDQDYWSAGEEVTSNNCAPSDEPQMASEQPEHDAENAEATGGGEGE